AHGRANFGDAVDVDAVDDEVLRRRAVDRDVEVEERQSLHERDGAGGGGVHDRVRYVTRVLGRESERALTHGVVGEAVTVPGDVRAAAHDGHGGIGAGADLVGGVRDDIEAEGLVELCVIVDDCPHGEGDVGRT